MQRGNIGQLILHVLEEKPMHGYEIIRTLEKLSHGFWRPSAGSMYPTLQLLEEQGLIAGEERDGKKVYSLTDAGREQAKEHGHERWGGHRKAGQRFHDVAPEAFQIIKTVRKIALEGTDEQVEEAKKLILETNEKLSRIVAKENSN